MADLRPREADNFVNFEGTEVSKAAIETKRRWSRAAWIAAVTYVAWSPMTFVTKALPAGSTTRGVVLTLIPLMGVVAIIKMPDTQRRRRFDLLITLLTALVVWQTISVERAVGLGYLLHVVPGAALLALAAVARGQVSELSLKDIRFAVTGVLPALCALLILGWIAQYGHLIPTPSISGSTLGFSVHGYRLQGITPAPNSLGFLAALVTLVAFIAQSGKMSWVTRFVGLATLVASDSRTSIIALAVGLLALWVLGPGWSMAKRWMGLIGISIAGVSAWGLIDTQRAANTDVLSDRDTIWRDLVPYLHHLPIFGYGPDLFPRLVPLVFGPFAVSNQVLDPQNQWLNDSLEFGFTAAFLLTLFLFAVPIHGSPVYRRLLLFPVLAIVIVDCFSEVPLAVFSSIDGAFPMFLLVMWAPLRSGGHLIKRTVVPNAECLDDVGGPLERRF